MLREEEAKVRTVDVAWFRPREWRQHLLAEEPHWVEEEVVLVVGDTVVHELSWSAPLDDATRSTYEEALLLRARLAV